MSLSCVVGDIVSGVSVGSCSPSWREEVSRLEGGGIKIGGRRYQDWREEVSRLEGGGIKVPISDEVEHCNLNHSVLLP